jgi:putative ABC transport system permease protein
MQHDFYLAWRYLRHNKVRSLILVACLGVIIALPLALHRVLDEAERRMSARAEATPLLVGVRGSAADLVLNALYFTESPGFIGMGEVDRIAATGWADPLPVYVRFRVRGFPLVGVTTDYFEFRGLVPAEGDLPALLGDCVLGAEAARRLKLAPGDTLPTTPENVFDLAGVHPLKLNVTGILAKTHTPDDRAVFVDLQTAWVIEGLGHGHETGPRAGRADSPFAPASGEGVAYTEITPDNLASFHFHGDPAGFPISAVIAVPRDARASALLRGRYLDDDARTQIVRPSEVTRSLLQNIFRIGALFDAILLPLGIAALLMTVLVFALSLRLRQREIETIHLIGCSPMTVIRLMAAEIVLIACGAGVLGWILLQAVRVGAAEFVRHFVIA